MAKPNINKPDGAGTTVALAESDHPRYLGDPSVVESLLRPLFKVAADAVGAVVEGRMTWEQADPEIEAAMGKVTPILLGQDKSFQPMGDWNTGGKLPAFLRQQLPIKGTPDDRETVRLALLLFAGAAAQVIALHAQDPAIDWKGMVDDAITSYTGLFCGVPLQNAA